MSIESGQSERANIFVPWIQAAMLIVTIVSMIGGAILFAEVRATRTESATTSQDKQGSDHEQRLRLLESQGLRMEGKLDRLADRMENISRAVGARR